MPHKPSHATSPAIVAAMRELVTAQVPGWADWVRRADRIEQCGTTGAACGWRCVDCGEEWLGRPARCGLRWCERCRPSEWRRVAEPLKVAIGRMGTPRFLTLTIRNTTQLREGIERLWRAFGRLRKWRLWRERVRSAVCVLEVEWSAERGWHPHLHLVIDGGFIPWRWLVSAWERVTEGEGQRWGQSIEKVRSRGGMAGYLVGYLALPDVPSACLPELLQTLFGHHVVRRYGLARKLPAEVWGGLQCPACGGDHVHIVLGLPLYLLESKLQEGCRDGPGSEAG